MGLFQAFDITASGMEAQRFRMDTIAENIANVNTTRKENSNEPYRRKVVTFETRSLNPMFEDSLDDYLTKFQGNGVKVSRVYEDTETDFTMVYDPSHPDADENGYVRYPNVNTVTEMTNLIDSFRSYQANVTAFGALKDMASAGISIGNS